MNAVVLVAALVALASSTRAEASPETDALEERLESGDIDGDDLATLPDRATLSDRASRAVAAGRGHAFLSLVGFTRPWTTDTRETGGLVVVGIPLEKLALAHVAAPETTPSTTTAPHVATLASHAASEARSGALVGDVSLPPQVVRACVAAALRTSGLGDDERGIEALVARARWSATLPEVRLRAVQYDDQRLYTDVTTASDTSRLRDSAGAHVSLEARLTWRLDHLLFASEEPAFERIKSDRREARARVQKRVLEALFRWRRAVVEERMGEHEGDRTTVEIAETALRRAEAEATLDVLTGGWFSAWQARNPARRGAEDTRRGREIGSERSADEARHAETPASDAEAPTPRAPRAALDAAPFLGHWSPMLAESRDKLEDLQRRLMTLRGHL